MHENSSHDIIEQLKDECKEQKDITNNLKEIVLAYTAKLYQLPRNFVQNILDNCTDLVQQIISSIKSNMKDILVNNKIN